MEIADLEIIRLELKYCERCGALWLRERSTGGVYCSACARETADFPRCERKISRPQLPTNGNLKSRVTTESVRSLQWRWQA